MSWWEHLSGGAGGRARHSACTSTQARSIYELRGAEQPAKDDGDRWHRVGEIDLATGRWLERPCWGLGWRQLAGAALMPAKTKVRRTALKGWRSWPVHAKASTPTIKFICPRCGGAHPARDCPRRP